MSIDAQRTLAGIVAMAVVVVVIVVAGLLGRHPEAHASGKPALSVFAHDRTLVIRGCPAEDSCRINYRHDGAWVIAKRERGSW